MSELTAIVPAFNRPELTDAAVDALRRQSLPPAEILVVDDGSAVPYRNTASRVLRHRANLGFAAAVNTGLRAAETPLVAVINNDVSPQPDFLERLAAAINYQDAAFACGKLYRPDGRLDGTWDLLCRGGLAWRAGHGRQDCELFSRARPVRLTSFTACVIRRSAFDTAGLLDESYETYYEDVEWSLRAGLRGCYEPGAVAVHLGGATSGTLGAFAARQILRNHQRLAVQYLLPEFQREYTVARTLLRANFLRRGQWPDVQAEPVAARPRPANLAADLLEMENEILSIQEFTEFDTTWRWYARLTA